MEDANVIVPRDVGDISRTADSIWVPSKEKSAPAIGAPAGARTMILSVCLSFGLKESMLIVDHLSFKR